MPLGAWKTVQSSPTTPASSLPRSHRLLPPSPRHSQHIKCNSDREALCVAPCSEDSFSDEWAVTTVISDLTHCTNESPLAEAPDSRTEQRAACAPSRTPATRPPAPTRPEARSTCGWEGGRGACVCAFPGPGLSRAGRAGCESTGGWPAGGVGRVVLGCWAFVGTCSCVGGSPMGGCGGNCSAGGRGTAGRPAGGSLPGSGGGGVCRLAAFCTGGPVDGS